ncbi:UNVERIFIED_CONTAM: hypothetical protein K2H54_051799 [Gekko kuhli]
MERDKKEKEMNILRSQLTMYVEAHDELEEKLERMEPYRKKTHLQFLEYKVFENLEEIKQLKEKLER